MPQGRRKVPFSGKAKKEQLKAKRQNKETGGRKLPFLQRPSDDDEAGSSNSSIQKLNYQPTNKGKGSSRPNKYALQFYAESNEEIRVKKEQAYHSLRNLHEINEDLEVDDGKFFDEDQLDFPKRPQWKFDITKAELEAQENKYFHEYLKKIEENYNLKELSYFELNLETWRQLWRVLEISDVILFIVDIRYCSAMFPPSLYKYVTNDLKKNFILVLNKIDLAAAPLVAAWKHYFEEKYPLLRISIFTSLPGYNLTGNDATNNKEGLQVRRRKGRMRMAAEGTQKLLEICKDFVGDKVNLKSWENKIKADMNEADDVDKAEIGKIILEHNNKNENEYYEYEKFKSNILTIGCIGQPNVGKSSLMNAIMGKKVVSVSKTPGHTKHFQTIFLTPEVRLCDCPGLVFPSKVPKPLQVLMGSFPIAQLREPYTTIRFLAERMDLIKLLRIEKNGDDHQISPMDICEGWAKQRGYVTAKAARLDTYRAANSILRMALDGKICLCLKPPGYLQQQTYWANHSDVNLVKYIQAKNNDDDDEKNSASVNNEEGAKFLDNNSSDGSESDEKHSLSLSDDDDDEALVLASNKFSLLDE